MLATLLPHNSNVWAVGNNGSLATLAIHSDGESWIIIPTPAFDPNATNQVLIGIVARSNEDIWTTGQYIVPIQGSAQYALTENWDGSNWNFVSSPNAQTPIIACTGSAPHRMARLGQSAQQASSPDPSAL